MSGCTQTLSLSNLRSVHKSLSLRYLTQAFTALKAPLLTQVSATLSVRTSPVVGLDLPSLSQVGSLQLDSSVALLNLPALVEVSDSLNITGTLALYSFVLPQLQAIGGDLIIVSNSNPGNAYAFPLLATVGGMCDYLPFDLLSDALQSQETSLWRRTRIAARRKHQCTSLRRCRR